MPYRQEKPDKFKPAKNIDVKWESFEGGWNDIFTPTELEDNELTQADNLMLIGKGSPTGRWGSDKYNLAGENGRIRLLSEYKKSSPSTNELLTITDDGLLAKKNGASYTNITGTSFFSGLNYQAVQMDNNVYIAGATLPLVRYDGTNLIPYTALSKPTNTNASMLSSASGTNVFSWVITALNAVGETTGSTAKTLASLPLDLSETLIKVTWDQVSSAPSVLTGYNIYRGTPGNERFIGTVGTDATEFLDSGKPASDIVFPPLENTTVGIRAGSILKFDDRIVLSRISGEPSAIYISGRYPYHDRFTLADGGGKALVSPDDGDYITALGIAGNQGMGSNPPPVSSILAFKNHSTHRITLAQLQVGNYTFTDPIIQLLTDSSGCSSDGTVVVVENDTFYFGRKGLYSVGQEPQFLNQIRTNELSARIRPYVRNLSTDDFTNATAGYIDNKYLLSFPDKKETIVYDRERMAFMGPWKTPWGITKWHKYFDAAGDERWLAATTPETGEGPFVREFSDSYVSDSGEAIGKILRTKKSSVGDWSVLKVLKLFYVLFRNVRGNVGINLRIETKDGNTVTSKTFSIVSQLGDGGFGADQFGSIQYGDTDATIVLTGDEIVRYAQIYKNARVAQVEVESTEANSNWEFLGLRLTAQPLGDNSLPASVRV